MSQPLQLPALRWNSQGDRLRALRTSLSRSATAVMARIPPIHTPAASTATTRVTMATASGQGSLRQIERPGEGEASGAGPHHTRAITRA